LGGANVRLRGRPKCTKYYKLNSNSENFRGASLLLRKGRRFILLVESLVKTKDTFFPYFSSQEKYQ